MVKCGVEVAAPGLDIWSFQEEDELVLPEPQLVELPSLRQWIRIKSKGGENGRGDMIKRSTAPGCAPSCTLVGV